MNRWVGVISVLRIAMMDGWMGGCNARFKDYFAKTVKSIDVAFSR